MFDPKAKTKLDLAVDKTLDVFLAMDVTSPEATELTDLVVKLHKMKEEEKPSRVDKNTLALIAANLAGIVLVITHERVNVITSKAMNLVQKPR